MQTFLPYPNFLQSVQCLDWRRLGKQRVEAYQLLRVLNGQTKGWANHPAARMWRGHEDALALYMSTCIMEWTRRGYRNTMELVIPTSQVTMPSWLGDPAFHASHRSNLLRKDPAWYSQWDWTEPPNLPYVWPVR